MQIKTLFLCLVILFPSIDVHSEIRKLTVITEDWPPYNYVVNGEVGGFSVDIFNRIIERSEKKYDVTMKVLPSARIRVHLDMSNRTVMFSMYRTPERERKYKWIGPLIDGSIYFYKRQADPITIKTLEDAKRVERIACRHMGIIHDILTKEGFTNLDTTATESVHVYKKLLSGRSELGISDTHLGVAHQLKQLNYPLDALTKIPIKVFSGELYIATSLDIPDEEITALQKILDELRNSWEYHEILEKYR